MSFLGQTRKAKAKHDDRAAQKKPAVVSGVSSLQGWVLSDEPSQQGALACAMSWGSTVKGMQKEEKAKA